MLIYAMRSARAVEGVCHGVAMSLRHGERRISGLPESESTGRMALGHVLRVNRERHGLRGSSNGDHWRVPSARIAVCVHRPGDRVAAHLAELVLLESHARMLVGRSSTLLTLERLGYLRSRRCTSASRKVAGSKRHGLNHYRMIHFMEARASG